MENKQTDLLSLYPEELQEFIVSLGEPKYRAKQIFTWLHRGKSPAEMTDIPKGLRAKLEEKCIFKPSFSRLYPLLIYIYNITYRLECIE